MDLTLAPDTRINIDQLARDLQVSNTPLREALARLESEGLVTRRNLQGFRTTGLLNQREMGELFAMRLLLEPEAARGAAAGCEVTKAVPTLREILTDMERVARRPVLDAGYNRDRDLTEGAARFHTAIAIASGSRLMVTTLVGLNAHTHHYRLYFRGGMADTTTTEHEAILCAIRARDPEGAARAMRTHLEHSRDRLLPMAETEE